MKRRAERLELSTGAEGVRRRKVSGTGIRLTNLAGESRSGRALDSERFARDWVVPAKLEEFL